MKKYLLILVVILAFLFRFYRLNELPAFNADEAAIGYNAYSLLLTGKDEHGNPWPLHFQSFNDYKPGFYFYLVLPFVKILGLNEWAVRFPGALLGVLSVYAIYFLAKEIHSNEKFALLSSLLLAISPWHIHFSRGAWEVNVSTFFIIVGTYGFLKWVRVNDRKFLFISAISYVLSLYTYHSARIVVPILVLGISLINIDKMIDRVKVVIISLVIGLLLLFPLTVDLVNGNVLSRASGVGLLADSGPLSRVIEQRGEHANYSNLVPKILHNKMINYSFSFLANWGKHYWGEFLFLSGDEIQRNKVPETGQLYLIEVVFLSVGGIFILKDRRKWVVILFWLVVAPIAASFTFQSPHSLRAHNMIIPLNLISAFGFLKILDLLNDRFNKKIFLKLGYLAISLALSWSVGRYIHMYYVHMSKEYPFSSQYGVRELVSYIKSENQNFKNIVITTRYDQPYILFLFYLKYSPQDFQNNHTLTPRDKFGFSTVTSFDKYIFKDIDFEEDKVVYADSLIAGTDEQIPNEANIIKKIYGSNDYLYFEVMKN